MPTGPPAGEHRAMPRLLLPLIALLALALPAAASAKERPEWTACTLSDVPKRMSMSEAFTKGIPATYTCHVAAHPLVTVMIADPKVKLSSEDKLACIAWTSPPPIPEVPAGTTKRIRMKVQPWPRKAMRRHRRVRVIVEASPSLTSDKGPFYSSSKYGKYVVLENPR